MKKLTSDEMYLVSGGAVKWGVVALVSGAIVLIVGILDGFTNPSKCHN